jgi:ADP-ribose pyrophosphatase
MIGTVIPESQVTVTHVGPVFRVERLRLPHPRPELGDPTIVRDVVRHPGAVTVIAERDDGTLVLVRNRRVAVGRSLLEFCAGKLEPGEDPAAAARRELEEETGYAAGALRSLGVFFTSPGFTDEAMHVFHAAALRPVPQRLEAGEEIEVVEMGREAFEREIAAGRIEDGKSLGAYLLWRMREHSTVDPCEPGEHAVRGGNP